MNKYDLAAALTIEGLDDGKWHRLTAAVQRQLFGFPVMGKKEFKVDLRNQGQVTLRKSVIPNDTVFAIRSLHEVAQAINAARKLDF